MAHRNVAKPNFAKETAQHVGGEVDSMKRDMPIDPTSSRQPPKPALIVGTADPYLSAWYQDSCDMG